MIAHLQPSGFHVRLWKEGTDAKGKFERQEPYDGSMVIQINDGVAHVALATGSFDHKAYRQIRDELFEIWKVKQIRWDGNGRIQKPKRRKK